MSTEASRPQARRIAGKRPGDQKTRSSWKALEDRNQKTEITQYPGTEKSHYLAFSRNIVFIIVFIASMVLVSSFILFQFHHSYHEKVRRENFWILRATIDFVAFMDHSVGRSIWPSSSFFLAVW